MQHTFCTFLYRCFVRLRATLHGGGGPQVGEVASLGGVTRLSILSSLHDRWGNPPRRVTQSAGPGNPLSRNQIVPR